MIMIMISMNIIFLMMNHPMSMGLMLIMQTLAIAIYTGMVMKTFWMSYILVITMLSGMLVLFIYMSSIASNEKFKNKMSIWMLAIILITMSVLFLLLSKKMIIKNNYFSVEMSLNKMTEMFLLNKLFNSKNMMITIMLILYLLMTMIVSTHLVNISEGPMRLKYNYV